MRARKRLFSKFIVAVLTLLGSVALVAGPIWASAPSVAPAAGPSSLSKAQVAEGYGRLPLFFTENQGQVDSRVKFYARGQGHAVFFTSESMALSLSRASDDAKRRGEKKGKAKGDQALVQLRPQGMRPGVEILATEPLPGKVNYYQGNDPGKWRTEVPTYKSVLYREAYPGIDLKFYGAGQQVEYDLIIKPGADPKQVKFLYQGIKALKITKGGELTITLPGGGHLVQQKPVIYQEINGQRVSREGKFRLLPDKRGYGFDLASYDTRYPLIIDPVILVYSTYLGGNTWESGNAIAVDASGSAYVAGTTQSVNFPTTVGVAQTVFGGVEDAFVTKFNPAGNALVFSTYLGGADDDIGLGIAVDSTGAAYVAGETFSANFPLSVAPAPLQAALAGTNSAFMTKLSPTGTLAYSTYLGGSASAAGPGTGSTIGKVIAIDGAGIAYLAGDASSTNFPLAGASVQTTLNGSVNAFVAKINPAISGPGGLVYSTYLGGAVSEAAWGIAVNTAGTAIYVAGETQSGDFPISVAPFQATNKGFTNAFVTRIDPSVGGLAGLVYSTYLGGSTVILTGLGGDDAATGGIAVDAAGNAYVAGNTDSLDFPITPGVFQTTLKGASNAFVTKFDPTGTPVYSTYLGGNGSDLAWFIAVDALGNAYVTGETSSANFPLLGPLQKTLTGAPNAFVTKLNAGGTGLLYSTYLGGTATDFGFGIAVDSSSRAYVAGFTTSTNFPTKNPFQAAPALTATGAAFVAKLQSGTITPIYEVLLLDE
ncbi:MAG: hypothetical protein FJ121_00115 [Deltaproteobacteria bacterium]|nr:hypothetical protein [Deltaproteobacteria bacterium]